MWKDDWISWIKFDYEYWWFSINSTNNDYNSLLLYRLSIDMLRIQIWNKTDVNWDYGGVNDICVSINRNIKPIPLNFVILFVLPCNLFKPLIFNKPL